MKAVINPLYPNRVQIQLSLQPGPKVGLLFTTGGVAFDPRRDLEIYFDGLRVSVLSFSYDSTQDQYLIFTDADTPIMGLAQIIYHLPEQPFGGAFGPIGGFALIATVSEVYDPIFALLAVSVPIASNPGYVYFFPPPPNTGSATVTTTGFGSGGFGGGGYGGKTLSNSTGAIVVTGFGAAGFGAGGFGGQTVGTSGTSSIITTGFGAAGFGGGGFGGLTDPSITTTTVNEGWNDLGFGDGPFGGGTITTIVTANGVIPIFYVPALTVAGSTSVLLPIAINFYALGIAQVRIQSTDGTFDSGFVSAIALYGTINIPNPVLGELLQLNITAYDASGTIITQNNAEMVLTFAIQVSDSTS